MEKLTPHGFEHEVRGKLLTRGFDHDQLGKLRSAYDHALVESGRHEFEKDHFDEMWGHMEGHPALKNLSEKKLETVKSVLKNHLGIKDEQSHEEETETA
ncbi:MAG: hypothetical protein Q8P23_01180 [bacterium]|nr:hypothetical protein [bacterium]